MGKQLGIHLSTIEEIHKNMRVTKETKEEKMQEKGCVCAIQNFDMHFGLYGGPQKSG